MENERIEDNYSFKDLKKTIDGFQALHRVVKLFGVFGLKNKELDKAFEGFEQMKHQFEMLSKSPDRFNELFAKKGWIAHESMNQGLMLTAIQFADKGHIDLAEQALIDYYSSDQMHWLVCRLRGVDAFSKRYELLQLAYQDTLEGRFHSAIPIVLMMMDGAVNDIDKGKGFFAENTDVTAWNSIAAHSTGLKVLKKILSDTRKRTTEETLTMPYRHGILHGRDLGYANRTVAAKSWLALFAVNDWARSLLDGKKTAPPEKPEPTLKEQVNSIIESARKLNESKAVSERISEWKARDLVIGADISEKCASTQYEDFTPEQEAIRFAEYWSKKKYGLIAKQIHQFSKKDISEKKEAGRVRTAFEGKNLIDYKLTKLVDCTPAISEVTIEVIIEYEGKMHEESITLRMIYQGLKGETLILGDKNGQWKFIESFFYRLESIS
jgi:hypothetical protein